MNKNQLAQKIHSISYLQGDFLLRSGARSKEYFDKYRFEAQPELLKAIAQHMAPLIPPHCQALAGLEMGGLPIAVALSFETGLPVCFVRKEAKTYGTCRLAEGLDIKNKNLCIIEDVITSGGQVLLSATELKKQEAMIDSVLCVIDREQGGEKKLSEAQLNLKSLFKMSELLQNKV